MAVDNYLLDQFADDVRTTDGGQWFLALLDEWQPKVLERTFTLTS